MMFLSLAIHFINLFAAAIVAGGQTYVFMVLIPTKRRFTDRTSVEVHNAMLGHQTDYYMKPAGIVSGLSGALALALAILAAFEVASGLEAFRLPVVSVVFLCLGLLGTLGVAITSRYFNVPTNAMMLTWSLDAIPANYPEIRRHWDLVHTIRASCGVTAFTSYLIAALARIST